MQDDEGQIAEAHSVCAGLDYPGSGPEHAHLAGERPRAFCRRHRRGGAGRVPAGRAWRGSSRRSRPRTRSRGCWPQARTQHRSTGLPLGRGDKDLAEVLSSGRERASASPTPSGEREARRADALPHGRLPRPRGPRGRSARPTPTAGPTSSSSGSRSPTRWPTGPSSRPPAPRRCGGRHARRRPARGRGRPRRARPGRAHVLREPRLRAAPRPRRPTSPPPGRAA